MEKIFKEMILISTKHITDTSLVHPYQKDFTKKLKNLENNADTFTGYIRYDYSAKPMKYQKYDYIIATYSLHHLTE